MKNKKYLRRKEMFTQESRNPIVRTFSGHMATTTCHLLVDNSSAPYCMRAVGTTAIALTLHHPEPPQERLYFSPCEVVWLLGGKPS